jgi:hypothetical protein
MATLMNPHYPATPQQLAEAGEKIYNERYRQEYERSHMGSFVAIDAKTGKAYLGKSSAAALQAAHSDAPQGAFHLIKVGSEAAFRVSHSSNGKMDWLFR